MNKITILITCRYFEEYDARGIQFWGMTAQNEPGHGRDFDLGFNCMGWNASAQRQFVEENLGPSLEAAGYGDLSLMIADEQRPFLPKWTREVFQSQGIKIGT